MASFFSQEEVGLLKWAPYENCSAPSILHFPYLGLPDGLYGTILPILVLLYFLQAFTFLCSEFFLPALCDISESFSSDVIRGTVMAAVATLPELVISVIGTFLTEEDVGPSAIIGSAVFNTLVIPGVCALVASESLISKNTVDTWSLTRDSIMYGLSILGLAIFFQADVIYWYEALSMVLLYALYLAGMQVDKRIKRKTTSLYYKVKEDIFEDSPLSRIGGRTFYGGEPEFYSSCDEATMREEKTIEYFDVGSKKCWYEKVYFGILWPITQTMCHSIPTTKPWWALLSCSFWISAISYIISWMITVIGYKLRLPDSLMALTVLGAGVGIPELLVSVGVARKGKQTMALCNALGANIINTLLCLGIPWLVKMGISGSKGISFNTDGLSYNCYLTLVMVFVLYIALAINNFVLDKKIGWFLLSLYSVFFVVTVLIEMNVFFIANLPLCNIKDFYND